MNKYLVKLPEDFGPKFEGLPKPITVESYKQILTEYIEPFVENTKAVINMNDLCMYQKKGEYYLLSQFDERLLEELINAEEIKKEDVINKEQYMATKNDFSSYCIKGDNVICNNKAPVKPAPAKKSEECIIC